MQITDQEKATLEVFTADEATFNLVQKIAKGRIEQEREMFIRNTTSRKGQNPIDVGTKIQIFDEALLLAEAVFKYLRQFKKTVDVPPINPGR